VPDFSIPSISNVRLDKLMGRIRPVARRHEDGVPRWVTSSSGPRDSYLWDMTLGPEALGLVALVTVKTLHSYGSPALFKPSLAEVFAQIPADLINEVGAFEMVVQPETAADMREHLSEFNAGFHVAEVMLYQVEPGWPFFGKTRFDREDPV